MMARKLGEDSLSALLSLYGEKATEAAKKALEAGADAVVEDAKSRCPVLTGTLRDSIHKEVQKGGTKIKVVADAQNEYGVYYGKVVEFSPNINKPFLFPAVDAKRNEVREAVGRAIQEAMRK